MRIQVISDLHLEFPRDSPIDIKPVALYLALCGDISVTFGQGLKYYREFMDKHVPRFKKIFVIAGNHEAYHRDSDSPTLQEAHDALRRLFSNYPNVYLLERESHLIEEGWRILGCTLWSLVPPDRVEAVNAGLNDYSRILVDASSDSDTPGQADADDKAVNAGSDTPEKALPLQLDEGEGDRVPQPSSAKDNMAHGDSVVEHVTIGSDTTAGLPYSDPAQAMPPTHSPPATRYSLNSFAEILADSSSSSDDGEQSHHRHRGHHHLVSCCAPHHHARHIHSHALEHPRDALAHRRSVSMSAATGAPLPTSSSDALASPLLALPSASSAERHCCTSLPPPCAPHPPSPSVLSASTSSSPVGSSPPPPALPASPTAASAISGSLSPPPPPPVLSAGHSPRPNTEPDEVPHRACALLDVDEVMSEFAGSATRRRRLLAASACAHLSDTSATAAQQGGPLDSPRVPLQGALMGSAAAAGDPLTTSLSPLQPFPLVRHKSDCTMRAVPSGNNDNASLPRPPTLRDAATTFPTSGEATSPPAAKRSTKRRPLTIDDTNRFHARDRAWLERELAEAVARSEQVIVLTHHAPIHDSDPNHPHDEEPCSSAFESDLSELIAEWSWRRVTAAAANASANANDVAAKSMACRATTLGEPPAGASSATAAGLSAALPVPVGPTYPMRPSAAPSASPPLPPGCFIAAAAPVFSTSPPPPPPAVAASAPASGSLLAGAASTPLSDAASVLSLELPSQPPRQVPLPPPALVPHVPPLPPQLQPAASCTSSTPSGTVISVAVSTQSSSAASPPGLLGLRDYLLRAGSTALAASAPSGGSSVTTLLLSGAPSAGSSGAASADPSTPLSLSPPLSPCTVAAPSAASSTATTSTSPDFMPMAAAVPPLPPSAGAVPPLAEVALSAALPAVGSPTSPPSPPSVSPSQPLSALPSPCCAAPSLFPPPPPPPPTLHSSMFPSRSPATSPGLESAAACCPPTAASPASPPPDASHHEHSASDCAACAPASSPPPCSPGCLPAIPLAPTSSPPRPPCPPLPSAPAGAAALAGCATSSATPTPPPGLSAAAAPIISTLLSPSPSLPCPDVSPSPAPSPTSSPASSPVPGAPLAGLLRTPAGVTSTPLLPALCHAPAPVPAGCKPAVGLRAWFFGHTHWSSACFVNGVLVRSNQCGYPHEQRRTARALQSFSIPSIAATSPSAGATSAAVGTPPRTRGPLVSTPTPLRGMCVGDVTTEAPVNTYSLTFVWDSENEAATAADVRRMAERFAADLAQAKRHREEVRRAHWEMTHTPNPYRELLAAAAAERRNSDATATTAARPPPPGSGGVGGSGASPSRLAPLKHGRVSSSPGPLATMPVRGGSGRRRRSPPAGSTTAAGGITAARNGWGSNWWLTLFGSKKKAPLRQRARPEVQLQSQRIENAETASTTATVFPEKSTQPDDSKASPMSTSDSPASPGEVVTSLSPKGLSSSPMNPPVDDLSTRNWPIGWPESPPSASPPHEEPHVASPPPPTAPAGTAAAVASAAACALAEPPLSPPTVSTGDRACLTAETGTPAAGAPEGSPRGNKKAAPTKVPRPPREDFGSATSDKHDLPHERSMCGSAGRDGCRIL